MAKAPWRTDYGSLTVRAPAGVGQEAVYAQPFNRPSAMPARSAGQASASSHTETSGEHPAARLDRPLILAVDDEQDARDFLRAALADVGFEFLEAASGAQALQMLEERRPDLLIVDVMMPGMTGLELCAHLRIRDDTRNIPIILYSAYPMRHSNAGLYDRAFVKPADLEELLYAIRALLPEG
jgi:putative two-component system response regulator